MEGKLSGKQTVALGALLEGENVQTAAELANVNRKTLARWLENPTFSEAYKTAADAALHTAARRLAAQLDGSVDALVAIRDDIGAPAGVRVRAALGVVDASLRIMDASDFADRLAALEQRLGAP